jgi:hypothetical protein
MAGAMLLIIALNGNQQSHQITFLDKAIVSTAFMASCVLGIVLSTRPRFLRRKGTEPPSIQDNPGRPSYVAHHPDCGSFDDRIVSIGGRKYCGGCLGLMLGSAIALVLAFVYLFAPSMDAGQGLLVFLLGMVMVSFCLVGVSSKRRGNWSHFAANPFLVLGFFLVVIGALGATGSVPYGLMAVVICFLWLDARIQISEWRHARTCRSCGRDCRLY